MDDIVLDLSHLNINESSDDEIQELNDLFSNIIVGIADAKQLSADECAKWFYVFRSIIFFIQAG